MFLLSNDAVRVRTLQRHVVVFLEKAAAKQPDELAQLLKRRGLTKRPSKSNRSKLAEPPVVIVNHAATRILPPHEPPSVS